MTPDLLVDLLVSEDPNAAAGAKPIFLIRDKKEDDLLAAPEALRLLARANNFTGEAGAVLAGEAGVLLGVGDGSDPFVAAAGAERLPEGDYRIAGDQSPGAAREAAFGWLLGVYKFDRYKKLKRAKARLVAGKGVDIAAARRAAEAVFLVRDLVNTPAGDMTPAALEAAARELAQEFGAEATSIVGDDLLTRNFPMVHAVGRAAKAAPRLIDMSWGRADAPKATIIGKGVSFDSGGLDIKNSESMRLMKKDMGGAANALGLARLVMSEKLDLRLRVIIPAVENAVAGDAFRPGDILKSRKGLTVEIANTDAEGRLILADAMTLAGEDAPQIMFTLATLTGAARVALGPDIPPFYTDDEALAEKIARAARDAADPVWRLPLHAGYEHMLSSPIADLNNSPSGSFAGSMTAALFLKRFAPEGVPWAHFDIYAWRAKSAPGRPVGGEAQAARALFEVLKSWR